MNDRPGSMDTPGVECSDEQTDILRRGSENYNQRPADAGDGGDKKKKSLRRDTSTCGGGHLETDSGVDVPGEIANLDTHKQNVFVCRRAKRFKRGAQQHVCNNEKMHPRNRHRNVFLDYTELARKYPYLEPHLRDARFGQCNIDFRDPLALYSLSRAILSEFYDLEFQLPPGDNHHFLIPCVPSRANYIHHIADLLADVDVEATAYLKGEIPGIDTQQANQNSSGDTRLQGKNNSSGATPANVLCSTVNSDTKWSSSRHSCRDSPSRGNGEAPVCDGTSEVAISSAPVNRVMCSISTGSSSAVGTCSSSSSSSKSKDEAVHPLRGEAVTVLDIGVGANCIYPLLGVKEYGWKFVGSDVSETSLAVAKRNVRVNVLNEKICLRLQPNRDNFFVNVVKPGEFYSLTMCNPPFHSSREQVNVCPVRVLEAQDHEVICEGGECQFISGMIEESKVVCAQVLWFTTLVARVSTVKQIKKRIWEELRNFNHHKQQQEKLLNNLWKERVSAKAADGRRSIDTPERSSMTALRAEAGDDGQIQAISLAQVEATSCTERREEEVTEDSAHRAEGKVFEEGKMPTHTGNGDSEEYLWSSQENTECENKSLMEEAFSSSACSFGKQKAAPTQAIPAKLPVHICEFRVKELLQGKQTRWVICWTYWTQEQRRIVRNSIKKEEV